MNIKELQQKGWRVKINHFRLLTRIGKNVKRFTSKKLHRSCDKVFKEKNVERNAKGGKTVIELTRDGLTFTGQSQCSMNDNFNKKLGLQVAVSRLLSVNHL